MMGGLTQVTMDTPSISDLQTEIDALSAEMEGIVALDESDIDDADITRLEEIESQIKRKTRILEARKRLDQTTTARTPRGRRTAPEPRQDNDRVPATVRDPAEARRHGFVSFGEFARSVFDAAKSRGPALERLHNAATTYGSEQSGADGGFLVPPEFSDALWQKVQGDGSLMGMCAPFTTSRNSLTFPKDETTPWDNSAGIRVFWEGEGDSGTAAKPRLEQTTARLNKLMALIPVSEELAEDAAGLDSYLRTWTPIKMASRINTAIVRGTGAGQPLGIVGSGSAITITKETSQDAASIIMPNINKMWNRLYAPLRSNAVWLINQECEPQLEGMQFIPANEVGTATTASIVMPVYLPPGGLADTPYARLKGRPVIPMNPCSALGTLGDIILVDLMQYMALTKGQQIQEDTSMHIYFDQALECYRFIFRMTGQPLWNNAITPENGSNTYSWAVMLETRS